jgi:hypothetical protein
MFDKGVAVTCPIDARQPAGFECRATAGPCDVAEQVWFALLLLCCATLYSQCDVIVV